MIIMEGRKKTFPYNGQQGTGSIYNNNITYSMDDDGICSTGMDRNPERAQ